MLAEMHHDPVNAEGAQQGGEDADDFHNIFRWVFSPIHGQVVFHRGDELRGAVYLGQRYINEINVYCDDVYLTDQTYVYYENNCIMVLDLPWENNFAFDPILDRLNYSFG